MALLAEAIRTAPEFKYGDPTSAEDQQWLGRTHAILRAVGDVQAIARFESARMDLGYMRFERPKLMMPLYDIYAHLELHSPASSQGAFIPPGEAFNGYAALVGIVKSARKDLLVVDPYVDATLFTEIAPVVPEGVKLRCLTSRQSAGELVAASGKWISTGRQAKRPVTVRLAAPRSLHDRHIIVDGAEVWNISQSIKNIAERSAASVTKDRTDLANAKVAYLEEAWDSSEPLPSV